jgi:hypothetical protein
VRFRIRCSSVLFPIMAVAALAGPRPATLQLPREFPAGKDPKVAVIADFNNDGRPDVAVAEGRTGDVSIP